MTIYGSKDRPHFISDNTSFYLVLPDGEEPMNGIAERIDPDAIRELIIGGIHALQDRADADRAMGGGTSATLAYDYITSVLDLRDDF